MKSNFMINLGCGPVFVDGPDWINLDFAAPTPSVRQANLLKRLPLPSAKAQLVYSSHFLEHIPKPEVDGFLRECLRILQPGGILRLVLPDLEEMARSYLAWRDSGEHEKANFLVLEMVDQCVRRESGGELGRLYQRLLREAASSEHHAMIAFIRERMGEDLASRSRLKVISEGRASTILDLTWILRGARHRLQQAWVRLWLAGLPAAFRTQNVSLAGIGERHHWLWDFHQLQQTLSAVGFITVIRCSADSSSIKDFPFHPLDIDADGRPRKGLESMYVEARKPD
ncbi:class I SAM-dependent methyltransferase [Desulfobulbus alkaliphilus]|uniref:class I SAM-dependent methyltransferase n=1 Tax=Desulfobulbus alkaliphilus TaxID=869814 RepID=UPI0019630B30|nr:methyltransferase domain-containing protein [Desulfobulbus alkaliphilus]MBM9538345.1 methyltransferase domain-containing protein [Desulfobulbus alkaliphilus]